MAAILEPTHTYWLTATQILSLAFLALATVISGFRLVRNLYRPSKQSQVRLPGDTRSPLTRKEEFSMNLLDGIETLPEGEGDFVEEERFWQKVCVTSLPSRGQLIVRSSRSITHSC